MATTSARESSSRHASDRKRPRSDSDSESDAHDRRRHKDKKKRKSSKKHDKKHDKKKSNKKKKRSSNSSSKSRSRGERTRSRRHAGDASSESSSDSGSDSEREREAPHGGVDHEHAAEVVRTLLVEFPSISSDLLALLQMLDDGETAVISGIANARVKTLLGVLFPLLGLKKLRKPEDTYIAPRDKRSGLLETVATMLTDPSVAGGSSESRMDTDMEEEKADAPATVAVVASVAPRRREAPIGPMMLPSGSIGGQVHQEDDDDDGEIVGPALPGMKGYREADERVEAEMARRAKQLEEDEWRRARGEPPLASAAATAATGGRQAWMTEMPADNKIFKDAMGPVMKPRTGQPAAFRSKEPAKIDSTWFDSPEERERAKRAKLDIELLGYVRPENASAARITDHGAQSLNAGPSVNESILPAANPEADEDMRRQMDALKQKRGPSLLEQHQQKIAEQQQKAKAAGSEDSERSTWNRDRDLTAGRGLSQGDADRIITASKEISSKFTAPTVTRQFL